MADLVLYRRKQTVAGVTTTVDISRCKYCGHSVVGTSPNYVEEFSTPAGGSTYGCRARGGTNGHVTH